MKRYTFLLLLFCNSLIAQKGKTILAIFAHPDDEVTLAPVLAKYAGEGAGVYLAIVTDGRLGVNEHAGIPAGDTLAAIRVDESKCAAAALGIHPPVMWGFHDQLDIGAGFSALQKNMDSIHKLVVQLITKIQPDVILTWGAGGWTGHPDHCLVGNIVTTAYTGRHYAKNPVLYYAQMPAERAYQRGWDYALADSSLLTVRIPLNNSDMTKAKQAWLCHKSQFQPADIESIQAMIWDKEKPVSYFIRFAARSKITGSLF